MLARLIFLLAVLACPVAAQHVAAFAAPLPPEHYSSSESLKPIEPSAEPGSFAWGRALKESFMFLGIQHGVLGYTDRYYISQRGGLFNNYWPDYKLSLRTWSRTGWDDGDPFLDNYIAHPIQGALTGYIQVQNDPRGRTARFGKSAHYWKSRLKATAWSAAYSTQFEIGPLSEMTVQKYGTFGSWEQDGKMINGTGQVDLVITPTLGLAWMVAEDALDEKLIRRLEHRTSSRFWINFARSALNPIRAGANILHGKAPWHRYTREPAGEPSD